MKAKELAQILMDTPEAEVVHYVYTGGDTPLLKINATYHQSKGEKSDSIDRGHFVDNDGIVEEDIVILGFDPNKEYDQ